MSTVKRITKNTFYLIISDLINKILGLVFIFYVARFLGDTNFGKYSFALAFTLFIYTLTDIGLSNYMVRELARNIEKINCFIDNILSIKIILSLLSALLIVFLMQLLDYSEEMKHIIYIFSIFWIVSSFSYTLKSIFRSYEIMEYEALTSIIERLISFSYGIYLLFSGYGLIEISEAILFASIMSLLIGLYTVCIKYHVPRFSVNIKIWKQILSNSVHFGLVSIFIVIYFKIDVIMLSFMKGNEVVGWYNASYILIDSLMFISSFYLISIYPVLSRYFIESKESMNLAYIESFRYLFVISLPIAIGTTLLSEEIILLIYGSEFVNSINVLKILIWSLILVSLNSLLGTVLRSANQQKINSLISLAAVALNIGMNLLLIPKYSLDGAAFATLLTEFFVFIAYYRFTSKFVIPIQFTKMSFKPLVSGIIMGIIIIYLKNMAIPLFLTIVIGAISYLIVLHLTKEISSKDKSLLKNIIYR
jgi:O-antigen/teichoic acid export membrane protein